MSDVAARQAELIGSGAGRSHPTIFLHIGKTAGTTLSDVIARRTPRRAQFEIDSFSVLPPLDQLAAVPPSTRRGIRVVRGHGIYGVHRAFENPAIYTTILRDPTRRLVSAYWHVRTTPAHRLYARVQEERPTFVDFVTSGLTVETDNWQVRSIAGDITTPFGECDDALLDRARRNIERDFAFVGLSERFDESLVLFAQLYRWRHPCYVALNRAKTTAEGSRGLNTDDSRLLPYVALDQKLYEFAAELFDDVVRRVGGIDEAVGALRRRNSVYRPVRRTVDAAKAPVRYLRASATHRDGLPSPGFQSRPWSS